MKKYIFLIVAILSSYLTAQNFFPAAYKNCVLVEKITQGHGGWYSYEKNYVNGGVLGDTLIDGKIFIKYKAGNTKLFYYDQSNQIVYIRVNFYGGIDSTVKAFNFNLQVGEEDTSWYNIDYYGNYFGIVRLIRKEIIRIGVEEKIALTFEAAGGQIKFIEDVGLLNNRYYFDEAGGLIYGEVNETLISEISGNTIYNQIELAIASTNLMEDTPINHFPFEFKVNFEFWSMPIQLDTFHLNLRVIRNGTTILNSTYDIDKDSFNVMIPLDSTILEVNDSIFYSVHVTDTSIFNNNHTFPSLDYKKIKILNPVTSISAENTLVKNYFLSQNYPNPFNPTTIIKYSIPSLALWERVSEGRVRVFLKVYDILGNEVTTLVNEEKPPGEYEVEFDGSKLSSGVYFYQLRVGSFTQTNKMVIMR